MERVNVFVERPDVDEAVDEVEMALADLRAPCGA
jgi:hypothetical protein